MSTKAGTLHRAWLSSERIAVRKVLALLALFAGLVLKVVQEAGDVARRDGVEVERVGGGAG